MRRMQLCRSQFTLEKRLEEKKRREKDRKKRKKKKKRDHGLFFIAILFEEPSADGPRIRTGYFPVASVPSAYRFA